MSLKMAFAILSSDFVASSSYAASCGPAFTLYVQIVFAIIFTDNVLGGAKIRTKLNFT